MPAGCPELGPNLLSVVQPRTSPLRFGTIDPADVHFGRTQAVLAQRQQVLRLAYQKNPERFVKGQPTPPQLPPAVWINPAETCLDDGRTGAIVVVEVVEKWAVLCPLFHNPERREKRSSTDQNYTKLLTSLSQTLDTFRCSTLRKV